MALMLGPPIGSFGGGAELHHKHISSSQPVGLSESVDLGDYLFTMVGLPAKHGPLTFALNGDLKNASAGGPGTYLFYATTLYSTSSINLAPQGVYPENYEHLDIYWIKL